MEEGGEQGKTPGETGGLSISNRNPKFNSRTQKPSHEKQLVPRFELPLQLMGNFRANIINIASSFPGVQACCSCSFFSLKTRLPIGLEPIRTPLKLGQRRVGGIRIHRTRFIRQIKSNLLGKCIRHHQTRPKKTKPLKAVMVSGIRNTEGCQTIRWQRDPLEREETGRSPILPPWPKTHMTPQKKA